MQRLSDSQHPSPVPSSDIRQTLLPSAPGVRVSWGGLHGSADALAIANAHRRAADRAWLVICASPAEADRMAARLAFYHRAPEQVRLFPDAETLPYDSFSPHTDLISERIRRLAELARGDTAMLVVSAATLLARLPPAAYVARSLSLHSGQQLDTVAVRRQLEIAGYSHVSQVMEHGEFAVRGSLIDLFPMGESTPVRIDLFDDVIDTLKRFDPESQRSTETLAALEILPAREFPLDEAGIRGFRQRFRARFEGDPARTLIYREVSAGNAPGGIEYYLPLFFDDTASLLDYLPADSIVCMPADMPALLEAQWQQACERHEQMSVDPERPLLAPAEAFWAPDALLTRLSS